METPATQVLVFGHEALVDLIPREGATYEAVLGGSPFNTAVGLGRLGVATAMSGRLSTDTMGDAFATRLAETGIDTRFVPRSPAPSPCGGSSADTIGDAE